MYYDCRISDCGDYARVQVRGRPRAETEVEDMFDVLREVARWCREHRQAYVLMILDLPGPLSTWSAWRVGAEAGSVGWMRELVVSVVQCHPERREGAGFVETVAHNHGFTCAVFGDEAEAMAWLKAQMDGAAAGGPGAGTALD